MEEGILRAAPKRTVSPRAELRRIALLRAAMLRVVKLRVRATLAARHPMRAESSDRLFVSYRNGIETKPCQDGGVGILFPTRLFVDVAGDFLITTHLSCELKKVLRRCIDVRCQNLAEKNEVTDLMRRWDTVQLVGMSVDVSRDGCISGLFLAG